MNKIYLASILFLVLCPYSIAQISSSNSEKQRITDFCISLGFPRNAFDRSSNLQPFGLTYNFLFKTPHTSPFIPGFGFSYYRTSHLKSDINVNASVFNGSAFLFTQQIPLKLRTVNQLLNVHLLARIQGEQQTFKPFVDLIAGVQCAWTQVTLTEKETGKFFQTDSKSRAYYDTQKSDFSWIAGGSFGLLWKLNSNVYINSNVAFLFGGKLNYIDRTSANDWNVKLNSPDIQLNNLNNKFYEKDLNVSVPVKTSLSNMLVFQLGLTAFLD